MTIGNPTRFIEKVWNSDIEGIEKFHEAIQENLNCCGLTNSSGCPAESELCMPKIRWGLELASQIVGGLSFILMILFIFGAVAAFKIPNKQVRSCNNSDQADTITTSAKNLEIVPDVPIAYEVTPSPYYTEYEESKKLEDTPVVYKDN